MLNDRAKRRKIISDKKSDTQAISSLPLTGLFARLNSDARLFSITFLENKEAAKTIGRSAKQGSRDLKAFWETDSLYRELNILDVGSLLERGCSDQRDAEKIINTPLIKKLGSYNHEALLKIKEDKTLNEDQRRIECNKYSGEAIYQLCSRQPSVRVPHVMKLLSDHQKLRLELPYEHSIGCCPHATYFL